MESLEHIKTRLREFATARDRDRFHSRKNLAMTPRLLPLLLGLFALTACGQQGETPGKKGKPVHLVETAAVVSDNLNVVRTRTGTLQALREVKVFAREEGLVTALPFHESDRVSKGDVVVELDDTLLRAQLARATATRKQAKQDLQRQQELRDRKLAAEDAYSRAITGLEVAEADEQVLKTRHGYTTIRTPISGLVIDRFTEPGNLVQRLEHVLTIADPSSLITELPVSELIRPELRVGDSAAVRIDALGDQVFQGRITRIHPSLDPVTRRGTIEVELNPVPDGAAPGQLCRVELTTHASRRKVIPFVALRRDEQSEYVFILDSASKAQRVNVKSGLRLAELIEITEGLEENQQVIIRGFLDLAPGKVVKPVNIVAPG
jgi:membrane fusion protein (multidrug efflux system)